MFIQPTEKQIRRNGKPNMQSHFGYVDTRKPYATRKYHIPFKEELGKEIKKPMHGWNVILHPRHKYLAIVKGIIKILTWCCRTYPYTHLDRHYWNATFKDGQSFVCHAEIEHVYSLGKLGYPNYKLLK